MNEDWKPREPTTHQDHVIVHVIDASVLGYFILDEALYVLLDIGFVWSIFLDCEMGLMPHPVAVNEMEISERLRQAIRADIDLLLSDSGSPASLRQLIQTPVECQIKSVDLFEYGDQRRMVVRGDGASLAIETSLTTAEIKVYEY